MNKRLIVSLVLFVFLISLTYAFNFPSSEDTVNPKTGAVISDPDAINMDKVIRVTKVDVEGVFKLVFTYMSINMQKTIEWSYALGSERNTVYGELTAPVAGLTFLS